MRTTLGVRASVGELVEVGEPLRLEGGQLGAEVRRGRLLDRDRRPDR